MKIAILGRTQMLINTMDALREHGHTIVLIGTCAASDASTAKEGAFEAYARRAGIPFFNNVKLHDPVVFSMLQTCGADIGISLNWMSIITEDVRALFPYSVLNAHAGDLPRYRGNATPNWAILNGEEKVTFCIHEMLDALDAGPVYARFSMPLTENTRVGEVYDWMETAIPAAYAQVVDEIERDGLSPVPQPEDPALALRCYPRLPEDSQLDWNESASHLQRMIHASSEPFSGSFTYLGDTLIRVWRGHGEPFSCPSLATPGQVLAIDRETGAVRVAAGDGVLVLESISVDPSGERILPAALIRSLRARFHTVGWIPRTPCF